MTECGRPGTPGSGTRGPDTPAPGTRAPDTRGPGIPGPDKRELRARLRARRRDIAATRDLLADGRALATQVLPLLPAAPPSDRPTALSYESLPEEPPTGPLHAALTGAGWRVLVPITLPSLDLDWHDLADPARTPLGTTAPAGADVAVVPGLAVDTAGTRLGQGGGCYDRVLPRLRAGTPVLLLLHPGEVHDAPLPREPHDRPVRLAVTAEGVRELG